MERYSLIVVTDETAPIRRFDVRKDLARRLIWGAAIAACVVVVGLVDYIRVRIDHVELQALRVQTAQQKAQIDSFDETLSDVQARLERLRNFERKVRIIANLPGSVATGGEEVTAIGSSVGGDLEAAAQGAGAVRVSAGEADGDDEPKPEPEPDPDPGPGEPTVRPETPRPSGTPRADRVSVLRDDAERLGVIAGARELSLADLLEKLESKRDRLASTPAIWPTKGWLTSRFGNRISPFTGGLQFHAGIDIAGARGTDVIAPARGRVVFSGKRGPLGQTLVIDHGYNLRTVYGHIESAFVKRGQQVERGQVIAALGNTGRSTGPHLHYVVEVKGKAVNPLDYIFD
jgi:murein DD-endopeptidase MepM/ murein hydrolase activator NlpD